MTGLRLGYVAVADAQLRDRMKKVLFYTASNIASVVQFGGIGALEGSQECIDGFRQELKARRDLFYDGIRDSRRPRPRGDTSGGCVLRVPADKSSLEATRRRGELLAVVEHDGVPDLAGAHRMRPRCGFRRDGEGYVRFCFARDRAELRGALESMKSLFVSA